MASSQRPANQEVIAKVEKIFADIADSLLRKEEISIPLRYKKLVSQQHDAGFSTAITKVSFPARTPQEARRFTVLLRILDLIHEALCNDEVISKRNIYYKDPALFKSQHVVDKYVDIFAYTFGIQRAALNVTAAAKGLVVGDYTLLHTDGTRTHHDPLTPHLIPDTTTVKEISTSHTSWILVIEKEVPTPIPSHHPSSLTTPKSTFRTLASSKLHQNSHLGKGIIFTAKGYPDISTRAFLHHLASTPPPIYILVDHDPDGLAIMSTYAHGSRTLSHENSHLFVPNINWLGIRSSELVHSMGNEEYKGLLRLSGRDRNKGRKMLENNAVLWEDGEEGEWRRELQVMLMMNVKAEMEVLAERDGGVVGWVEGMLMRQDGYSSRMVVDDEDATTTGSEDDDDLGRL